MTPLTPLQQQPCAGPQGVGIATLIFRYFLRYFSSTHRTDLSRFRGAFHSFDPVGFAIFATAAKIGGAVGMRVTSHPPHRSVRAAFPHTVSTSGIHGSYARLLVPVHHRLPLLLRAAGGRRL